MFAFRDRLRGWFLLSLFVAMIVTTGLHHHVDVVAGSDCYECSHHLSHGSHVDPSGAVSFDCVLCQLCHVSYILAMVVAVCSAVCMAVVCRCVLRVVPLLAVGCMGLCAPRGPPSCRFGKRV